MFIIIAACEETTQCRSSRSHES